MVACCNAQAGQTDDSDLALAQGQEALNELRDMGWDEAVRCSVSKVPIRLIIPIFGYMIYRIVSIFFSVYRIVEYTSSESKLPMYRGGDTWAGLKRCVGSV